MIANETALHQSINEVDIIKYWQPYGLQKCENPIPYGWLPKAST